MHALTLYTVADVLYIIKLLYNSTVSWYIANAIVIITMLFAIFNNFIKAVNKNADTN